MLGGERKPSLTVRAGRPLLRPPGHARQRPTAQGEAIRAENPRHPAGLFLLGEKLFGREEVRGGAARPIATPPGSSRRRSTSRRWAGPREARPATTRRCASFGARSRSTRATWRRGWAAARVRLLRREFALAVTSCRRRRSSRRTAPRCCATSGRAYLAMRDAARGGAAARARRPARRRATRARTTSSGRSTTSSTARARPPQPSERARCELADREHAVARRGASAGSATPSARPATAAAPSRLAPLPDHRAHRWACPARHRADADAPGSSVAVASRHGVQARSGRATGAPPCSIMSGDARRRRLTDQLRVKLARVRSTGQQGVGRGAHPQPRGGAAGPAARPPWAGFSAPSARP